MALNRAADMKKVFKLPMLPGNSYGEELLKKNFRKAQILGRGERVVSHDVPVDFDALQVTQSVKAGLGGTNAAGGSTMGSDDPSLSLDRKVLRFHCYFKEGVHESAQERERVRRCIVYYFLEDDTVSVSEVRTDNSGMPQGALIKRHLIPGITFEQFNIGYDVSIYGKVFHVTGCDDFTRAFLEGVGVTVPDPETDVRDEYTTKREAASKRAPKPPNVEFQKAKMTAQEVKATTQFLANDRKVLRFKATWDDSKALNGAKRFFNVYYFLADDTIEVIEQGENNSGRDPFPSFVRRQKCPKATETGKFENPTASLTFGNRREMITSYTDADLRIGTTLNIFGRNFFLYDCDAATQAHLKQKFGVTDFTPIDVRPAPKERVRREPPPHNGFGDEEDALGSWKNLVLKPPKRDMAKFMDNSGTSLKFELKMVTNDPCDEIRRFVLTYFLADDTIAIFEPAVRNSGIIGGKFLQRGKIKNAATGEYFKAHELFVGANISIHKHVFTITSSDERSVAFMEQHSQQYPHSNINLIMCKLRSMLMANGTGLREAFDSADRDGSGGLNYDEFAAIISQLNLPLSPQEILTVMRYMDRNDDGSISYSEFISRLCPDDTPTTSSDNWEVVYEQERERIAQDGEFLDRTVRRKANVHATKAAYAAREFHDQYLQRKQLFNAAFQQICDYSPDGKIGPEQFRTVCIEKLQLNLAADGLESLCDKLFPPSLRRASYSEFVKLLNNSSCHDHNLAQIIARK
eukprot:PhM_4_TR17513/c0_g1_i1/m.51060